MSALRLLSRTVPLAVLAFTSPGSPGVPAARADGSGQADDRPLALVARLQGLEETPAIVTTGKGRFRAEVAADGSSITFELTYSDLESPVAVAHIHVGQRGVAGGVSIFFCGGGGRPACPPGGGTVTGTATAADVVGPVAQGVAPGQLDRVIRAVRAGATYVNVHTSGHPGGEIRGQVKVLKEFDDRD